MASPLLALAKSYPPTSPVVAVTKPGLRKNPQCWSELPLDLMQLVFGRLGFEDYERAKSVCSSWQYGSRTSKPNNKTPWLILFPEDSNYCHLLNPENKEKLYKTQDLGNDFGKSDCVATYKSWLLMKSKECMEDFGYDLYILDLLTGKRINLPSHYVSSPILWIDEKTKNYLVIGMYGPEYMFSLKNGDDSWQIIPGLSSPNIYDCFNLVYKDHKLYCLTYEDLHIFDFSSKVPLHVFSISVRGCVYRSLGRVAIRIPHIPFHLHRVPSMQNIVVTLRGDILIVRSKRPFMSKIWEFEIYKMDSSEETSWVQIFSLGDESIILDLGITVLAKDLEGITSNSIYFTSEDFEDEYEENKIFIFNLDTKKFEQPQPFVSSSILFSNACWFLPSFKGE